MSLRPVLLICLLWPALATARDGRKAPEDWSARTKREAIGLFKVVLPEMEQRQQPCFFDKNWETIRPVSAELAQKYLGSNMEADLVASHLGIGTQDILDPEKAMSGSFCEEDEWDRKWTQRKAAFREGRIAADAKEEFAASHVMMTRAAVSMPVFDRAFTTAVIIVGYNTDSFVKVGPERVKESPRFYDENGYDRYTRPEGFGYTQVYRKRRGAWVRIFMRNDWSSN